jgi:hypothetical protein
LVQGKADWKPRDKQIMIGEWLSYAADAVPGWKIRATAEIIHMEPSARFSAVSSTEK